MLNLQLSSLQSHSMEESSYPHQNDILFRTEQNDQKKESSLKGEKNTFIWYELTKFVKSWIFIPFQPSWLKVRDEPLCNITIEVTFNVRSDYKSMNQFEIEFVT